MKPNSGMRNDRNTRPHQGLIRQTRNTQDAPNTRFTMQTYRSLLWYARVKCSRYSCSYTGLENSSHCKRGKFHSVIDEVQQTILCRCVRCLHAQTRRLEDE